MVPSDRRLVALDRVWSHRTGVDAIGQGVVPSDRG